MSGLGPRIKNTEVRTEQPATNVVRICTKDEVYTRDSGDSVGLRTHPQPHQFMQVVAAQGVTAPLMHSVAFPISRFSSWIRIRYNRLVRLS